jgi:hypothetical protein
MIGKLRSLFSRYPEDPGVHPGSFNGVVDPSTRPASSGHIAVQSVPDKFYFLLFGALRARLPNMRAELVVVRAVSGAVGTGWMAEVKRSAPIAWLATQPWVRAYGDLFDGVAYRCADAGSPLQSLRDWFQATQHWERLRTTPEPVSLTVEGIEVGDLLVDSYLRFKPSPEFEVHDPFVRRLIWQTLKDVRRANDYFNRRKPALYLTSYTTYLEHGIPARVALNAGVPVWSFGNLNQFGKKLSLENSFHTSDFSGYRSTFESLDGQAEKLELAREQLELRLSGGIDAATSYMRKSAYGQSGAELPPGLAGAVVVFLHDFYDSPHVYPDLVFDDFWRWICYTIDVLQTTGVPFFLKPHPNQIALSDEALSRLRRKYPELQWLPQGVSNVQLAQAGIACGVTVYGTVAHELAYLGIPSIGCARHPHHTFDFCRTAHSVLDYKAMLKTPALLPASKDEMQREALAFYYMHNIYGDDDRQQLRHAFVEFWKACNLGRVSKDNVLDAFARLINLKSFDQLTAHLKYSTRQDR